jgi:hypothetical protein
MNRIIKRIVPFVAVLIAFMACHDSETYADQKDRERDAINAYIVKKGINPISEKQFEQQGYTTNLERNEYVLFDATGVYMQIVRKGCGEKLKDGEAATLLCRFTEYNILGDSVQLSNENLYYSGIVDKISVRNTSGTFTASFDTGSSLMARTYSSASVPQGWLVPLTYINIGRPQTADDEVAKVNIIVPHTQGQYYATQNVIPCAYEITYQRGR